MAHTSAVTGTRATFQRTHTANFVDILKRQAQRFVSWTSWWQDAVQGLKQSGPAGTAILTGDLPSLEPGHL